MRTVAPSARVVSNTMLVETSSGPTVMRLEAEDDASLKSDVMFRYGGKKSEEELGDVLDVTVLKRESEVRVEEEDVLKKDVEVPEEELKL